LLCQIQAGVLLDLRLGGRLDDAEQRILGGIGGLRAWGAEAKVALHVGQGDRLARGRSGDFRLKPAHVGPSKEAAGHPKTARQAGEV
jgi:hypothetical protein